MREEEKKKKNINERRKKGKRRCGGRGKGKFAPPQKLCIRGKPES